ncbi:hypothetical protein RM863_11725 [Streptomyces sp. DSM 41014]|uniref:Uncharacterized protein n=1 Tax=Streptomyces hintoniae TaxID=3075521 RepID=A0ABU2UI64_9ACTN|nr:hypothetical protein [Streptomyces sp. DSM 41014]MDT0472795.1 hypothetical protein [Streptomyces sp. DSM 41014]
MKNRVMLLKAQTRVRAYRAENIALGIPGFGVVGVIDSVRTDLGLYRVVDGTGRTTLVDPRTCDIETYTDRRYL